MDTVARHGGLRQKRCLTAEFHPIIAHYPTYTQGPNGLTSLADSLSRYPQVTADHSHSPKARQLTLFYRLLPYLCRIQAKG